MEVQFISSAQNPKIKRLLLLQQKSQQRRKEGVFVVEGRRELEHCVKAGFDLESAFVREEGIVNSEKFATAFVSDIPKTAAANFSLFTIPSTLYERIAYRGSTEGIVAIVKAKSRRLEDLQLSEHPLIVVLESVEKPGNLGAVLRSADAAQADAVVVCDPLTDLYNPNLIRSSIGAIFTVPTVACSSEECISFCKEHHIQILTAQLQDSSLYYDTDMTVGTAIVMGTESTGLTDQWRKAATAHIRIPMLGRLDSLNVSVSAAILLFEAVRQRQKFQTYQSFSRY